MIVARAGTFGVLFGLCGLIAGCQSTPTVARMEPRTPALLARNASGPEHVVLQPGMEIQWQAHPAQEQPGQVRQGRTTVGPDGAVAIGPYGSCTVAGLDLTQATAALEKHLAVYM